MTHLIPPIDFQTPISAWHNLRDRLYFNVLLAFLAAPSEGSPLRIKQSTTYTSNFAHEIGDPWKSLWFENVELSTSNSAIQTKVRARRCVRAYLIDVHTLSR